MIDLKDILDKKDRRMNIIKGLSLEVVRDKYGDERRSKIEYAGGDLSIEDMIPNEKVVITISHAGYIKRTSLTEYKTQIGEVLAKKHQLLEMKIF